MKSMLEQMESLFGEEKKAYKPLHKDDEIEDKSSASSSLEFDELSGEQLKAKLLETWGYEFEKLIVWGKLERVTFNKVDFIKLTQIRSIHDNSLLEYPIETENSFARRGVYIEKGYAVTLYDSLAYRFIKCELEFSPGQERKKHENPFLLKVKNDTAEALNELPLIPNGELVHSDDNSFISQSVFDSYIAARKAEIAGKESEMKAEIAKNLTKKQTEFESLAKQIVDTTKKLESLSTELHGKDEAAKALAKSINAQEVYKANISNDIESLRKTHMEIEQTMANKIHKLTEYIKSKATLLKDLEFIDADDFDELILNTEKSKENEEMLSFEEDLGSDYSTAVSHIQAHLFEQHVYYPKHIIENFLTLIRTNDLIILAGDSGSGKSNLVQSFAKAIGGVSKTIPVKPNWTSSEDLLGYYNPLEKKYLATPFLEALFEAKNHPDVPYLICLDEMNLARVEYYFADFLSKLEERNKAPIIELYSDNESSHVLSELSHVIEIINGAKEKYQKNGITNFVKLMQDNEINEEMRRVLGFNEKDSLIKYHGDIRRMLSGLITTPSQLELPPNVRIIGAINIDETTHYLSPKIIDRAHIMKFKSPLLSNWDDITDEVERYGLSDVSKKLLFKIESLGLRATYPKFDKDDQFCQLFVELNRDYLSPMGIEFGMRTISQGLNYIALFKELNTNEDTAINNFLLHKVLPKLSFDGNKSLGNETNKADLLRAMLARIEDIIDPIDDEFSALNAFNEIISKAESNDWIVNYWS